MLDLNLTFVFQLVNFFIAIFFLNILLIRPVREIIKKRNALMDEMAAEADSYHKEAVTRLDGYEAELAKARKEGSSAYDEQKQAALAQLREIVGNAQESAKDLLEKNRSVIQGQAEEALSGLRDGIDGFATRLGDRLLGK